MPVRSTSYTLPPPAAVVSAAGAAVRLAAGRAVVVLGRGGRASVLSRGVRLVVVAARRGDDRQRGHARLTMSGLVPDVHWSSPWLVSI